MDWLVCLRCPTYGKRLSPLQDSLRGGVLVAARIAAFAQDALDQHAHSDAQVRGAASPLWRCLSACRATHG